MNFGFPSHADEELDPVRDTQLGEALGALDPAHGDANYWLRFRGEVLEGAARELARRRAAARLTVQDVLSSWSRTLVPTALLAAAVAGIALIQAEDASVVPSMSVDEMLVSELPLETVPVLLSPDEAAGVVAFASDEF